MGPTNASHNGNSTAVLTLTGLNHVLTGPASFAGFNVEWRRRQWWEIYTAFIIAGAILVFLVVAFFIYRHCKVKEAQRQQSLRMRNPYEMVVDDENDVGVGGDFVPLPSDP